MKILRSITTALLPILSSFNAFAAVTVGDIAVIGFHGDSTDDFSWVPLVELSAGEEIFFTDAGYSSASGGFTGVGHASEFLLRYTVPAGGLAAGSVQRIEDTNSVPANYAQFLGTNFGGRDVSASGINLNQSAGDSVTIFQSTDAPTNLNFGTVNFTAIFALDTHDTPFTADPLGISTTTDVAPGLSDGFTAVSAPGDNTRYTGATIGTRDSLLAAITNDSNWVGQDTTPAGGTWSSNGVTNFTVSAIPEPSTGLLLGGSIFLLSLKRRRRASLPSAKDMKGIQREKTLSTQVVAMISWQNGAEQTGAD